MQVIRLLLLMLRAKGVKIFTLQLEVVLRW